MFRNLPTYGEYRPTRMPWCPSVPGHWRLTRNKRVMAAKAETVGARSGDYDLLSLTKAGVIYRDISNGKGKIPASFDTYQTIEKGDLIMCLFDVDETPRTVGRARQRGMITGAYDRFVVGDGILAEYVNWFYLSVDDVKGLRPLYRGLRKTVPLDQFMASQIPLPPAEEQTAIVKYLAHANARIDKAIAAKRRLNALLREQSELRHDAIVLGISSASDRLASGESWFGDVPSGWAVEPLRARYRQQLGKMLSEKVSSGDYMRPYLRNVDVQWETINVDDLPEMSISPSEEDRYVARHGDVLVCEGGDVGRAAIWEGEDPIAFQKALHRLRVISPERDDPRFLVAALRVAKRAGAFSSGRVSTIQHLTGDQIRRHRFAWPPFAEQVAIAEAVSNIRAAADATATKIEREIALLREFRSRLFADVVTGQVDVRAIAATLPDATEMSDNQISELDDDLEEALSESEK